MRRFPSRKKLDSSFDNRKPFVFYLNLEERKAITFLCKGDQVNYANVPNVNVPNVNNVNNVYEGNNKIYGRQPLKDFSDTHFKFFKCCPRILPHS